MNQLINLGWDYRFDSYETYWKDIKEFRLFVTKHINNKNFSTIIIDEDDNEFELSDNSTVEWVIKLEKLLNE